MNYKKYIKYILSVTLTVGLSCGLVFAWTNLTQVSTGDILTEKVLNDIIDKINENGNKLSTINSSGRYIPPGFTVTNNIVHSALMPVNIHSNAASNCTKNGAHICTAEEYRTAGLGWEDDVDPFADDHLFWEGSISWNAFKNCTGVSRSLGGTVEAGWHTGNAYSVRNITACDQRGVRKLKYHCCIN